MVNKKRIKSNSKQNALTARTRYDAKQNQILAAVKYCIDNKCRGKAALNTGRYPLIKDHKTITRRLNGEVSHGEEHVSHSILLNEEEDMLVDYAKNMDRAAQTMTRKEMNSVIIMILKLRQVEGEKLSKSALTALTKGGVGKHFWYRFDAKHVGFTNLVRNPSISIIPLNKEQMISNHLFSLREELINLDIIQNSNQVQRSDGNRCIDTSRVFSCYALHEEIDLRSESLTCSTGNDCSGRIESQVGDMVTVMPFVGMSGTIPLCQVIFSSVDELEWSVPQTAVDNIDNLLLTTTSDGRQDWKSFLESLMQFDRYLAEEGITRPVLLLSDHHSSRFDLNVLRYMRKRKIVLFVLPPLKSSKVQPLKTINESLHTAYVKGISNLRGDCIQKSVIKKEVFLKILAENWKECFANDVIVQAFRKAGITNNGISICPTQIAANHEASLKDQSKSREEFRMGSEFSNERTKERTEGSDGEIEESPTIRVEIAKRNSKTKSPNRVGYTLEQHLRNNGYERMTPLNTPCEPLPPPLSPASSSSSSNHFFNPIDINKLNMAKTSCDGNVTLVRPTKRFSPYCRSSKVSRDTSSLLSKPIKTETDDYENCTDLKQRKSYNYLPVIDDVSSPNHSTGSSHSQRPFHNGATNVTSSTARHMRTKSSDIRSSDRNVTDDDVSNVSSSDNYNMITNDISTPLNRPIKSARSDITFSTIRPMNIHHLQDSLNSLICNKADDDWLINADSSSPTRIVIGDWLKFIYQGECSIGVVIAVDQTKWKVRRLKQLPKDLFILESEHEGAWYEDRQVVGKCDIIPVPVDGYPDVYTL